MRTHTESEDAVDLWESEDLQLRSLFTRLQQNQGASVQERATYGDLAKEIIRHVAIRESAVADVVRSVGNEPELESMSESLQRCMTIRRPVISEVEKKSRGVQGINLNTGQDFHRPLMELVQQVGPEIEWELNEVVPAIRGSLGEEESASLRGADYLAKHAPTALKGSEPRWVERAPVISRLVTLYDRMRDFPQASRRARRRYGRSAHQHP
jgi:hypothetical protein